MKPLTTLSCGIICLTVAVFSAGSCLAQQDSGLQPKAAARSVLFDSYDSRPDQSTDQTAPTFQSDNHALSGLQNPTIGTPEIRHSYWVPGIEYSNAGRSDSTNGAPNSGWNTTSFLSTDMSLVEAWAHSTLSANYSGGGYYSTDSVQGHGQFHQVGLNYEIDGKRWQALIVDEFSYLPQSAFGFGGATGLSTPGITGSLSVPLLGLQSGYTPGQSILAVFGSRYSDSSAAQFTYQLSSRGSITIAGAYGLLRFDTSGAVNTDSEMGNIGYDYAISPSNTIGVSYRFSAFRYPGNPQALGDHVIYVEYGRKLTGKLGLKLAAGPSITTFRIPIAGSANTIAASGTATLTYTLGKNSMNLNYIHGTSSGSGVFQGSTSDLLSTAFDRQLTRIWNGSVNFGYARNSQILAASGSPVFDAWYAGGSLSRPLGHLAQISLGYQAQIQSVNAAVPNANFTVHQVFLSFHWHTRPLLVR